MSETKNGYGWCQSCGALVFNSSQCHKCGGKVKPFCVDLQLVQQSKRIKDLEASQAQLYTACGNYQERIKELEAWFDELIFYLEFIESNHEPRTAREWIDRLQALKG